MPRPGGPIWFRPPFLVGVVVVWSLLAFLPVVRNDFVNWDDFRMFLDNPAHRGSWADRLRGAWASHRLGEYMPVTWMSYGARPLAVGQRRVGVPPHEPAPSRDDGTRR